MARTLLEFAMSELKETTAKRISKLIRMFGSSFEPETHVALRKLQDLLETERLTFSDLAIVIENANGAIEERKYSDTDAEIIYARGKEKGREEAARERPQQEPSDFYDADHHPQWHAIAIYCQQNIQRLEERHHEFVDDMAGNTMWRAPTEKQGKYLLSLFVRLGSGRRR
jgi:hypothetical protein